MKNAGMDAGLLAAWKLGYTGKGIVIGIVWIAAWRGHTKI